MITRQNEIITSVERAVELLVRPWGSNSDAVVDLVLEPVLIVRHYRGLCDSLSSEDHYQIEPAVVEELKAKQLVAGTPQWGRTDDNVLQPTQLAVAMRWNDEKSSEEADKEAG